MKLNETFGGFLDELFWLRVMDEHKKSLNQKPWFLLRFGSIQSLFLYLNDHSYGNFHSPYTPNLIFQPRNSSLRGLQL